ncbi:hypothetical protein [Solirubrum puertoriconensis]|uniref:DUF4252 domain-containing protein n=1 Tax=Solirubrum puertoriconensis TaxID=1751427 RepID=A0A9X0HN84_SOLP1|nr:hypothetical protein [Solirubrum puertoriconensis]KUG09030.1 hypothetical protein ASU33_19595 [Solirubrum puertoriconensis]
MRLPLILTALILASSSATAQQLKSDLDKLDAKHGFRDVKLADTVTAIAGLQLIKDAGDVKEYKRSTDELAIGSNQLQAITYRFYRGRLAAVELLPRTFSDGHGIVGKFSEVFGTSLTTWEDEIKGELREWKGQTTRLSYLYLKPGNYTTITFSDVKLSERLPASFKPATR